MELATALYRALIKRLTGAVVIFMANPFAPAAFAAEVAPPPLRGKTAIIEWSETRMQRKSDSGRPFHEIEAQMRIAIYFSELGRAFGRTTPTVRGASANRDVVLGQQSSSTAWATKFEGAKLSLFQPFFNGGAVRRTEIVFGANFSSCSATISYAKRNGEETWLAKSVITQDWIEMQSVNAGPATCTVQVGNVFAN